MADRVALSSAANCVFHFDVLYCCSLQLRSVCTCQESSGYVKVREG